MDVVVDVGDVGTNVGRVRLAKLNGRGLETMPRNGLNVAVDEIISFSVEASPSVKWIFSMGLGMASAPTVDAWSVFLSSSTTEEEESVEMGVRLWSEVVVVVVVVILGAVNLVISTNGDVSVCCALTAPPALAKCTDGVGVTSSALSSVWSWVTVLVAFGISSAMLALVAAPAAFVSKLLFLLKLVCCVFGVRVVVVVVIGAGVSLAKIVDVKSIVGDVVVGRRRTLP